mgnify:CR=1 FL=1
MTAANERNRFREASTFTIAPAKNNSQRCCRERSPMLQSREDSSRANSSWTIPRSEAIVVPIACGPSAQTMQPRSEDRPITISPIMAGARAYRELTGREPVYSGVPGATDGTFLSAWKRIPCLVNGPGPRHLPHQVDEYVETSEMLEAARLYVLTAHRFLNGGTRT